MDRVTWNLHWLEIQVQSAIRSAIYMFPLYSNKMLRALSQFPTMEFSLPTLRRADQSVCSRRLAYVLGRLARRFRHDGILDDPQRVESLRGAFAACKKRKG
jgi:hypothetical protein